MRVQRRYFTFLSLFFMRIFTLSPNFVNFLSLALYNLAGVFLSAIQGFQNIRYFFMNFLFICLIDIFR